MRRLLALALLLLPLAASAQQVRGGFATARVLTRPGPVLSMPLTEAGVRFERTPGTILHLAWNGTQMVDLLGTSGFTMSGTVPQVPGNLTPIRNGTGGAGPFSLSNSYTSGTTGPSTKQGYVCAKFFSLSTPSVGDMILKENTGYLSISYSGAGAINTTFSGTSAGTPCTATLPNSLMVVCVGGSSADQVFAKCNGSSSSSGGTGITTARPILPNLLGRDLAAGPLNGVIMEVIVSTDPWVDTEIQQIQRRALGTGTGPGGIGIVATRAGDATVPVNGSYWRVYANTPRVGNSGLLIESAGVNAALASGTITSGTALAVGWLAVGAPTYSTAGVSLFPEATWGRLTSTTVGDVIYQARSSAATSSVTVSTWAKADTGTDTVSVQAGCAALTNTNCTCGRSDGGACTARPGVTSTFHCTADFTIGTTPVLLWATATCQLPTTSITGAITPGAYQTATGTADFTMVNLEPSAIPTSFMPSTGTAVARAADQLGPTTPATLPTERWCLSFTSEPYQGTWAGTTRTWWHSGGTVSGANIARLNLTAGGQVQAVTVDSAAAIQNVLVSPALGSAPHDLRFTSDTGVPTFILDGVKTGSPTGTIPGAGRTWFGTQCLGGLCTNADFLNGYLRNVRWYRSALCR